MILFNQPNRGTYWRAYHFAYNLNKRGHNVTVLITSANQRIKHHSYNINGIEFIESPDLLPGMLRSGWDPYNLLFRMKWIRDRKFDIIHSFESRPVVIYPALLGKSNGSTLIMDWCDFFGKGGSVEERTNSLIRMILRPIETYYENKFRNKACGTVVINSFLRQKAIDLGVPPDKIIKIYNGCDTSRDPIEKTMARYKKNLPLGVPIIGYLGNIYPMDFVFMLKATKKVLLRNSKIIILIIGNSNWKTQNQLIDTSPFIYTGAISIDDIHTYLSACDIFWLPLVNNYTNMGRFPMKINDYMTAGRPTVATRVGEIGNYVSENKLGIDTDVDIDDFINKTIELLDDPYRQDHLGASARYAAENQCNWSEVTNQLANFYKYTNNHSK